MKNLVLSILLSGLTLSNITSAQNGNVAGVFIGGHNCDDIAICYLGTHDDPYFQHIGEATAGNPCPAATPNEELKFATKDIIKGDPDCITVNAICANSTQPVDPAPESL